MNGVRPSEAARGEARAPAAVSAGMFARGIVRARPDPRLAQARIVHALALLQWPGWLALALLVAAIGAVGAAVALDDALAERQAGFAAARHALASARAQAGPKAAPGDVPALLARFDPADRPGAFVEQVHARAAAYSIQIDHAEYRAQADLRGRAVRYEIVLPARGEYPNLRNWLAAVLHDHPSAVLEELSLRRSAEGSARLDARVRLSNYLRSAP